MNTFYPTLTIHLTKNDVVEMSCLIGNVTAISLHLIMTNASKLGICGVEIKFSRKQLEIFSWKLLSHRVASNSQTYGCFHTTFRKHTNTILGKELRRIYQSRCPAAVKLQCLIPYRPTNSY